MWSHKKANKLLASLAADELSANQAAEVQAHLADCQKCRNDLHRLKSLLCHTDQLRELSAGAEAVDTATTALLKTINSQSSQTQFAKSETESIWRTIMKSRITKFAAAAAIIIGTVGLIGWLMPGDRHSGLAFADIVRPILTARTATCKMTMNIEGRPPVICEGMFMTPGHARISFPKDTMGGQIMICDEQEGKTLSLIPGLKKAFIMERKNIPDDRSQMDPFTQLREQIEEAQKLKGGSAEFLGEKEIDGQAAIGYRMKDTAADMDMTVWADPKTKLPIRVETSIPTGSLTAAPMKGIVSDFRFNVEIDKSLFSLEIPEGYTKTTMPPIDRSKTTEKDMLEMLRIWTDGMNGSFPSSLKGFFFMEYIKSQKEKIEAKGHKATEEDMLPMQQDMMKIARGALFARQMPAESDCHYVGKGVKLGEAEKPVFWYRPKDSPTYRVIYGDLSVRDVLPSELPAVPDTQPSKPIGNKKP